MAVKRQTLKTDVEAQNIVLEGEWVWTDDVKRENLHNYIEAAFAPLPQGVRSRKLGMRPMRMASRMRMKPSICRRFPNLGQPVTTVLRANGGVVR